MNNKIIVLLLVSLSAFGASARVEMPQVFSDNMVLQCSTDARLWGDNDKNMKFYYIELPGWDYGDVNGTSCALFREARRNAASEADGTYIVGTAATCTAFR